MLITTGRSGQPFPSPANKSAVPLLFLLVTEISAKSLLGSDLKIRNSLLLFYNSDKNLGFVIMEQIIMMIWACPKLEMKAITFLCIF